MPSQTFHQDVHHHGPPLPLPSHGVFRLLQSNTDPQSPHDHYCDLFEPSDMFVSLHEEKTLPPSEDLNALNSDSAPHEQDLRYEGDLYTLRWVRGHGNKREGWHGICIQQLRTNRSVIVRAARLKGVVNLPFTFEGVVELQSTIQCHTGPGSRAGLLSHLVLIQCRPLEFVIVPYAGCCFGGPFRAAHRLAARQGEVLRIDILNPLAKLLRKLVLIRTRGTSESSTEMFRRVSACKAVWQHFLEQVKTKHGIPDCAKLIYGLTNIKLNGREIRNTVFVARSMAEYEAMIVRKTHLEDSIVAREQFQRDYNGASAIDNLNFYFFWPAGVEDELGMPG
ncbi:hypothetical protein J3E69DRAFT_364754 [Trichoderma sp. SZMC 28015]